MRTSLVVAAALVAGTALAAQDWSQWRGPSRSGVAAAFAAPATWPDRPTRAWSAAAGAGHASPVVAGERAFVFTRLGEQEAVTAFDLATGRQLWQSRYDAPYQVNPAAASHGKGPKSTPLVDGGRVFTLGIGGIVSALDTASGRLLWRRMPPAEFDAAAPDFGVAMSPASLDGAIVVHVGGNKTGALMALDAATGRERWSWRGDSPAYASPIVATLGGVKQVVTQSRSYLAGIDAAAGALLWQVPFTTAYDQNIVTPVVSGDLVIYSGIEKPLAAVRVEREGGKWRAQPVWENSALPMYMSSPVLAGRHLYGFTHRNKGQFFAADAATGKTLWTTRGREAENAALAAAGTLLLATTTEGELVVLRQDASAFRMIRRYTVAESPVWAHPVPAGRGVLVKDADTLAFWTFGR